MNLANCPNCGKLFARQIREVCNDCYSKSEKEYESCQEFLKHNKGASIQLLSDETGVSIKQITRYIKEGRISLYNAPNLSYPCEVCGTLIREGSMCTICRDRLNSDVRKALSTDNRTMAQQQADKARGAYRIGDHLRDRN